MAKDLTESVNDRKNRYGTINRCFVKLVFRTVHLPKIWR